METWGVDLNKSISSTLSFPISLFCNVTIWEKVI